MTLTTINRLRLTPEQLTFYCGEHVYVGNRFGMVGGGIDGLYLAQTRFLSRLVLRRDGRDLRPVCANVVQPHCATAFYLTPSPAGSAAGPPGSVEPDGGEIAEKGIEIQINAFAGGGLHQDVLVTNRALAETTVTLDWHFAADFADLDELSSGTRMQDAPVTRAWTQDGGGAGELTFTYRHPNLNHATRIRLEAPGFVTDTGDGIRTALTLRPREAAIVSLDIAPTFLGEAHDTWYGLDGAPTPHHPLPDAVESWLARSAKLETGATLVQTAWERAVLDLASLQALRGEGLRKVTPMAGIPKYTALFGRDTLVAGAQSVLLTPATIGGALLSVGDWTATTVEDPYDAQPGKVLHQRQLSPLAILGKNPFLHYYGDYSAPGLFVLGAALHFAHTGDRAAFAAVRDKVFATLDWMDRDGDLDGDGFYEFQTRAGEQGIRNQGWKDSGQALLGADGRLVDVPVAVVEVQGIFYAAKLALAGTLAYLGEHARAADLVAQAAALKVRFNERFWLPDEDCFALALDARKAPVRTVTSDQGHCLTYGIVDENRAAAVRDRLMRPDLFSGWGLRTLSSDHPAYNPLAYHLGSVWPVSNAIVCQGLKRYGFTDACHRVAAALFDATQLFDYDRLPEVFGGHARDRRHPHPGIYPDACSPQAWSASAVVQVVHALAGLTPVAPLDTLVIDPALPSWLPELTLRNVQVGARRVDVALRRDASGAVDHTVVAGGEGLRVVRPEPLPEGRDRVAAMVAQLAN